MATEVKEPYDSISCQDLLRREKSKVIHSGWLRKRKDYDLPKMLRGKSTHSIYEKVSSHLLWGKKYVVVADGCLYHYSNEMSKKMSGAFTLYGYNRVRKAMPEEVPAKHFPWAFKMVHLNESDPIKNRYFAASSEAEFELWTEKIYDEMLTVSGRKPGERKSTEAVFDDCSSETNEVITRCGDVQDDEDDSDDPDYTHIDEDDMDIPQHPRGGHGGSGTGRSMMPLPATPDTVEASPTTRRAVPPVPTSTSTYMEDCPTSPVRSSPNSPKIPAGRKNPLAKPPKKPVPLPVEKPADRPEIKAKPKFGVAIFPGMDPINHGLKKVEGPASPPLPPPREKQAGPETDMPKSLAPPVPPSNKSKPKFLMGNKTGTGAAPLPSTEPEPVSVYEDTEPKEVKDLFWDEVFYPGTESSECLKTLKQIGVDGAFLIRNSTGANEESMTLAYYTDPIIRKHKIKKQADGKMYLVDGVAFATYKELINHYQTNCLPSGAGRFLLTKPYSQYQY